MSSVSSSPSTESITRDTVGDDRPDAPGATIIAVPENRFRRLLTRALELYRRGEAFLLPFIKLSKYGLGVALILCVTVIWVASSEWIQFIFGTLDYNKPFFLTYFNTTGFCLWNAGFLLSPRWRRTPWDEESKAQPVCIEDARLEARPRDEDAGNEDSSNHNNPNTAHRGVEGVQPIGGGVESHGVLRRVELPPQFSEDRNASVNLTLSCAVTNRSTLQDSRPPLSPGARFNTLGLPRPGGVSPPLLPHGATASPTPGPLLPHSISRSSFPSTEVSTAAGVGAVAAAVAAAGSGGSLLGDNDDVDMESDVGEAGGTFIATQLHMEDECRDYSLPTSFASSAREEVVSVLLTDEDDDGGATAATAAAAAAVAPGASSQPWEATRRSTVISSELLQHDLRGMPHRRRYHQRARRQRVLRYSLRRIWTCALYFCPLWFLANYLFNLSLSITSVASNTILSSTSSIWTLALSYVMLRQKVGIHRIVAVGLCVGGSIMVGLADRNSSSGHNTVGGDIVALLSAFFCAAYTSVLKWHLPDDERFAMGMVFGAVGVLNFLFLWPGLVILGVSGAEPFAWPTWRQFWPLLLNALIGTNLSDVLWARSVVLTSPVVATLGLSLTTPLAMIVDAIFKHAHFNGLYIAGAILVMVGFLLANLPIRINLGV